MNRFRKHEAVAIITSLFDTAWVRNPLSVTPCKNKICAFCCRFELSAKKKVINLFGLQFRNFWIHVFFICYLIIPSGLFVHAMSIWFPIMHHSFKFHWTFASFLCVLLCAAWIFWGLGGINQDVLAHAIVIWKPNHALLLFQVPLNCCILLLCAAWIHWGLGGINWWSYH